MPIRRWVMQQRRHKIDAVINDRCVQQRRVVLVDPSAEHGIETCQRTYDHDRNIQARVLQQDSNAVPNVKPHRAVERRRALL